MRAILNLNKLDEFYFYLESKVDKTHVNKLTACQKNGVFNLKFNFKTDS